VSGAPLLLLYVFKRIPPDHSGPPPERFARAVMALPARREAVAPVVLAVRAERHAPCLPRGFVRRAKTIRRGQTCTNIVAGSLCTTGQCTSGATCTSGTNCSSKSGRTACDPRLTPVDPPPVDPSGTSQSPSMLERLSQLSTLIFAWQKNPIWLMLTKVMIDHRFARYLEQS